ncbi:MAG: hypothetical protein HY828_12420 [Actinobacteria bacterium]|nr:hypothetical protein [Actinomycetota bacterium]
MNAEISPAPTDEEAVAIVAAVEALWPKPVVAPGTDNPLRTPTWRFSARWWAKPLPQRRDRPFR